MAMAIITPAISVLSAVEGLEVVSEPALRKWVMPLIDLLILVLGLFAVQKPRHRSGIGKPVRADDAGLVRRRSVWSWA